jgi:hypothetical protein
MNIDKTFIVPVKVGIVEHTPRCKCGEPVDTNDGRCIYCAILENRRYWYPMKKRRVLNITDLAKLRIEKLD